jgi:hypothetical protein
MSKRILLMALGAVLLFGNARVFANSITIKHNQMTLGTEPLAGIPSPGAGMKVTDNIIITVTNNTGVAWDDYTIVFITPPGGVFNKPNVVMIDPKSIKLLSNPFNTATILANNQNVGNNGQKQAIIELTGGSLAPGASFKISLDLTYNNSVNVNGTPSIPVAQAPEPSSLLLLGTGLLGLVPVVRRKLRV